MSSFVKTRFFFFFFLPRSHYKITVHITYQHVCMFIQKGAVSPEKCASQSPWQQWSFLKMTNTIYNLPFKSNLSFISLFFFFTFSKEAKIWELRIIFIFVLIPHSLQVSYILPQTNKALQTCEVFYQQTCKFYQVYIKVILFRANYFKTWYLNISVLSNLTQMLVNLLNVFLTVKESIFARYMSHGFVLFCFVF